MNTIKDGVLIIGIGFVIFVAVACILFLVSQ